MKVSIKIPPVLLLVYIGALALLAYSTVVSGLRYQYDGDEFDQAHVLYLVAHGYIPYKTFYTIYPIAFHLLLSPLFILKGFNFDTLYLARLVMVVLFFVRIVLGMFILKRLSNKTSMLIFPALVLLDPFTTFTGMQFRLDNLMLTFYLFGFFLLVQAVARKSFVLFFLSGVSVGLSLVVLIKILPSVALLCLAFGLWCLFCRRHAFLGTYIAGMLAVFIAYCLYFIANGTFYPMLQVLFIDSFRFIGSARYATPMGFFYRPDNTFIYGLGGKPLSWWYVWSMPVLGFIGALAVFTKKNFTIGKDTKIVFLCVLVSSQFVHWILLFTLKTVFAQYYLAVQWYFAFFGAVLLGTLVRNIKNKFIQTGLVAGMVCVYIVFAYSGYRENMARALMDIHYTVEAVEKRWKQIPENAYVFPYYLFRPIPYPLVTGYLLASSLGNNLIDRYPPMEQALETHRVGYLILSDYVMNYIPWNTQQYIKAHYTRKDEELYVRNDMVSSH